MVRPVGQRTLAGFTLGELLSRQAYGDVYRAAGDGRRDARLLIVAPTLASDERFNDALARGTAPLLGAFHHRAVVGTVVVARDGRDLVIVTDGVDQARSLDELLARARGRGLSPRIAATIARSVIDALATAHALGITHGAVHPRSILVDGEGAVRLTDFAVGYAAMAAAAGGSDAVELRGLGGYLAPEMVLGDEPSPAADVYATGALLFALLTGATPPGTVETTPAMERLIQRALDTDLHRRFANAIEVQENFAEALEDDRWDTASNADVAHALAELGRAPTGGGPARPGTLDDATEDLLASLAGAADATSPTGAVAALAPPAPIAPRRAKRGSGGLDSLLDDLEEHTDGALTTVDDQRGQTARDPISELIELQPAPAPAPVRDEPSRPRRAPALAAPDPTGETVVPAPAPAPVAAAPAVAAEPARRPIARPLLDEPPAIDPPQLGRSKAWLWAIVVLVVAAGLAYGISRQGKTLTAKQKEAAAERQRKLDEAHELEQRLLAAKEKPGTIRIGGPDDYGSVWLLLGRTPLKSIPITTANVWQLRIELEGYQSLDTRVIGAQWTGPAEGAQASITVPLTPGVLDQPLPVLPPEPPPGEVGRPDGRGILTATTTPAGAAVWLFVGQTNHMELSGIAAGHDYELKVLHDGNLPAYVRIAAEEWRNGGDPAAPLASAPMKTEISKTVELVEAPPPPKGKPR